MASNFPTSLDSYTTKTDNTDSVLAAHINDPQDAIEALEAKVGADNSAVNTSHDYLLTHLPGQAQNWDSGNIELRARTFNADVLSGTAPLTITSTTVVSNLNADKVDGLDSTDIVQTAGVQTVAGVKTFSSIPVLPASTPTSDNEATRKAYVDGKFNTSTGHDHDGTDSKKVLVGNLDASAISDGQYLKKSGSSIVGATANNFSNVIFSGGFAGDSSTGSNMYGYGNFFANGDYTTAPSSVEGPPSFYAGNPTGERTMYRSKFTKISGISTVTGWFRVWVVFSDTSRTGRVTFTIGSASDTVNFNQNSPTWKSIALDVSGLVNGTTYDITVTINKISEQADLACNALIGIAS